jgi:hypothetical protein
MTVVCCAGTARASERLLEIAPGSACDADLELLERRISAALIGTPDPELRVAVSLEESSGVSARLELRRGALTLGEKQIGAATCGEAIEAVIAIAALALGTPPDEPPVAREQPLERERRSTAGMVDDAGRTTSLEKTRARLLAGAGGDRGSLREPTLVLRLGAAVPLGPGELRAVAWYGLPSVREEISEQFERTRQDFGTAELDYCANVDGAGWIAACGGLEAGWRRLSRLARAPSEPRTEAERIELTLAAVAGLSLAYRSSVVQPALDVSAHLPVAGGAQPAPFGLRAVFGAALPF